MLRALQSVRIFFKKTVKIFCVIVKADVNL